MSFLDRWSRRKLEVLREKGEAKEKPAASEKAPAPVKAEDLPSVINAVERAKLAMELASTIRTKAVEAYQDIWRTQV